MRVNLGVAKFWLAAVLSLVAAPTPARAQGETTAGITGQVTDPSGAAVEGATVTVKSDQTGVKRQTQTDAAGRYAFPQIKPGQYRLTVTAVRFEEQTSKAIMA